MFEDKLSQGELSQDKLSQGELSQDKLSKYKLSQGKLSQDKLYCILFVSLLHKKVIQQIVQVHHWYPYRNFFIDSLKECSMFLSYCNYRNISPRLSFLGIGFIGSCYCEERWIPNNIINDETACRPCLKKKSHFLKAA